MLSRSHLQASHLYRRHLSRAMQYGVVRFTQQRADDEFIAAVQKRRHALFGQPPSTTPPPSSSTPPPTPPPPPERTRSQGRRRLAFLLVVLAVASTLMLFDEAAERKMESYEYLQMLFEALANDDDVMLDDALSAVLPLRLVFGSSALVHLYEIFGFKTGSPLAICVAVEQMLRGAEFARGDSDHCLTLLRDLRSRPGLDHALFVPIAWLELRVHLRAFAVDDLSHAAYDLHADPLRRIDAVANFLHTALPHFDHIAARPLHDRCLLAHICADLVAANEAFAVDRCRLGLDIYYDLLVRLQNERVALASRKVPSARGVFFSLIQHNIIHNITIACANFGRFDAVRDIDDMHSQTLGELVLTRDLAVGRGLANYPPTQRLERVDARDRITTLMLLCVQQLVPPESQSPTSLLMRSTESLEEVALATQNMALLLLLESPRDSIVRLTRVFESLQQQQQQQQQQRGDVQRFVSSSASAVVDIDECLAAEKLARSPAAVRTSAGRSLNAYLAAMPSHDLPDDQVEQQIDALKFLAHVSRDPALLAFVRGKLWHQFRGTQQALVYYDEALRLLERGSGDHAVVQAFRQRAARSLPRDDAATPLVDAAAAEEAERTLISLSRVAAANGVTLRLRTEHDPLRRSVADAVHGAGVEQRFVALAAQRAPRPLQLGRLTSDDLSEALMLAWTAAELGMCTPCLRRQRLHGSIQHATSLAGAGNDIDWRWLYAMQREWTNERSQ